MADTDVQTQMNETGDKAAGAVRRGAETGAEAAKKGADAVSETAQAGIDAEQRSFSTAADASRQSAAAMGRAAETSLRASQEMARQGQDMAKRATTQAADFWRSSLTPMSLLTGEFNRWFDQVWRGGAAGAAHGGPLSLLAPFAGQPPADLRETDRGYELCVDLPGLKEQDIELTVRGDMLHVSGEKAEASQGAQGGYRFSERRVGRIERAFALPPGADRSKIEAGLEDGVLRIQIPLSPEGDRPQTIPVRG